jgi:hypothetical protein
VAKHGYEVKDRGMGGWFSGVCSGHQFAPMQLDRTTTDSVVATVRAQAAELRGKAAAYEAGTDHPETVRTSKYDCTARDYVRIAWAEAMPFQREDEIRNQVHYLRNRAASGESWADGMEKLADKVHGQPLVEVEKAPAPEPIVYGEQRQAQRGVLTARNVERGMVRWTDERGFSSRMSTRSWRNLPKA